MASINETDAERDQRQHNEGQAAGAKAGLLGELFDTMTGRSLVESEKFNEGYVNGRNMDIRKGD